MFDFRYLVEWMIMQGKAMIYPSFPEQQSLSTHHREPGEHTHAVGQIPIVDDLTTVKYRFFTVPLLTNSSLLEEISQRKANELPVINFYHELMNSPEELQQIGLPLVQTFREYPLIAEAYHKEKICILDKLSLKKSRSDAGRNWITFEAKGSIIEQLEQLKSVSALGKLLEREVRVPKLKVNTEYLDISKLIEAEYSSADEILGARSAFGRKIEEAGIYPISNLNGTHSVYLPLLALNEIEVKRWFEKCDDNPLVINRADLLYPVTDSENIKQYLKDVAQELVKDWHHNFTCIDLTRPLKTVCKGLSLVADLQSFYEAVCKKPALPQFQLNEKIYAITDDSNSIDFFGIVDEFRNINPIYRRVYLAERLNKILKDYSWKANLEIAKLIEEEICFIAPRFIGAPYSLMTQRIITKRDKMRKRSEIIGRNK